MFNANRSPVSFWLLLGDLLVLLLFVFIGQRDHDMSIVGSLPSLVTTTLALAVPWAVAAWLLGALRLPRDEGLTDWLGPSLDAWLIAAPVGLLIRAVLRGQLSISVPFMAVVLVLGGLFVLAWRVGAYWWVKRKKLNTDYHG